MFDISLMLTVLLFLHLQDEDKFKFGRTKIFFRAGQVAYMEKLRADRLSACGVMIQKNVRMFIHKNRYRTMRRAAITIQRFARGMASRRFVTTEFNMFPFNVEQVQSNIRTMSKARFYWYFMLCSFLQTCTAHA